MAVCCLSMCVSVCECERVSEYREKNSGKTHASYWTKKIKLLYIRIIIIIIIWLLLYVCFIEWRRKRK